MRGLEKKTAPDGPDRQPDILTHGHGNSMTEPTMWGHYFKGLVGEFPL